MYAVVGSTGQVGGAVVRALRAKGKEVRALLRDESKAPQVAELGAEPFLASVQDGARLEMAFEGAEGVFVMVPPLYKSPNPRSENKLSVAALAHALQASRVSKAVLLSSFGAQHPEGTGAILTTFDMEEALMPIAISAVPIRAAYFMENLLPLIPHVKETGKLPVTWGGPASEIPMIAADDIGELAAELLTSSWEGKRVVELDGPKPYTMIEAARILSEKLGREITPEPVPLEVQQGLYESFGMTEAAARAMSEMTQGFSEGRVTFEGGPGVEHMHGKTTLEAFLSRVSA